MLTSITYKFEETLVWRLKPQTQDSPRSTQQGAMHTEKPKSSVCIFDTWYISFWTALQTSLYNPNSLKLLFFWSLTHSSVTIPVTKEFTARILTVGGFFFFFASLKKENVLSNPTTYASLCMTLKWRLQDRCSFVAYGWA